MGCKILDKLITLLLSTNRLLLLSIVQESLNKEISVIKVSLFICAAEAVAIKIRITILINFSKSVHFAKHT